MVREMYGGGKGSGVRGLGALGGAIALAPALQELLYYSMGLDPSGLEDEEPWFNPEGSSYEMESLQPK